MPLDPESQQLLQAIFAFMEARSWSQAQQILKQNPELMSNKVDILLAQVKTSLESESEWEFRDRVESSRSLLQMSRSVGVDDAFKFYEGYSLAIEADQNYQQTGQEDKLDAAIIAWECILVHPSFSKTLKAFQLAVYNNSGVTYLHRYWTKSEKDDRLNDLNRSLALWQQALSATLTDSPDKATTLKNLGAGHRIRYEHSGNLDDLEAAIKYFQQAVDATPTNSHDRTEVLNNLGDSFNSLGDFMRNRYQHSGNLDDLEAAIEAWQQAVDATPTNSHDHFKFLSNLGAGFVDRYRRRGDLDDLEAAIEAWQQAVDAAPINSPDRDLYLNNLGLGLNDRYEHNGNLDDLEAAIKYFQQAVDATPTRSPRWAMNRNNLGQGFKNRYEHNGDLDDLEAAIKYFQQAVDSNPSNMLNRAMYLESLGHGLSNRYQHSGNLDDLEAAIEAWQQAVDATPTNSPYWAGRLYSMGIGLSNRYRRRGDLDDLEAAIKYFQQAVDATPTNACNWAGLLNSLGNGLSNRYERNRSVDDLEAAIKYFQQAVDATPSNSPYLNRYLNNLGNGLSNRYERNRSVDNLEAAIKCFQQAIDATPTNSPYRGYNLNGLGISLSNRYERNRSVDDLEAAQAAFREVCEVGLETSLEQALGSARNWGNWALKRHAWKEAIEAYEYGTKAVERLLEIQLLRSAKETWLRDVQGLAANAAYAMAHTGDLKRAVEFIEGGRARLLAEALERNRHDLEQLPAQGHGELFMRYRQAVARWAALAAEAERPSEASIRNSAARPGKLVEARAELNAVIQAVRQVPGYADFLRTPTFRRIRDAVHEAPLVYLIATPAGGLALIVSPVAEDTAASSASGVQAVWFDALTDAAVREQLWGSEDSQELGGYLRAYARWRAEPRNPESRAHWFDSLETTTRWLWDALMGSLIAAVAPAAAHSLSSVPDIVLIPTGLLGLLPLHAAWTEDAANSNVRRYGVDVAALRYAPNARALAAAQALAETPPTERLLLYVEPQPVSANPLPAAAQEAMDILRYWPPGSYTDRWHMTATHEALVAQLPRHTYLHFAGHAFAVWSEPRLGGLLMASNQVLYVGELTGMRLPLRLAILSACETGVPGTQLPDEVIGLPTALMEAGVAGVVASFWSVADDSTAQLMAHFHRLWRQEGFAPPEALRRAQIQLRDKSYTHPFFWGGFAYTGL